MSQPALRPERRDEWTDERGWSHRIAAVNGVDLHYVTAGDSEDPPVVLLHGFPECWWAWRRHIDRLAESFRVIVPDMRGYNRSEKPHAVERYRLETLADDVAGLIEETGYDAAHVVAHDWGGVVAFGTALRRPESVNRLVVLNAPYPGAFGGQFTLRQALRSWYAGFFQLPAIPERLLSLNDFALLHRLFEEDPVVSGAYTDADMDVYRDAWGREGSIRAMVDYYRAFGRENIQRLWRNRWDAGRRVSAETLLLWGERDSALGGHIPNVIQQELDDVDVGYYPEASHWLHAEFPERTAADIEAFISR
jgi:pimeloyl-ACP methyl ester carboxylesterase